jgi:hypothetical protein
MNEEGITSDPDEVIVTVIPRPPQPPTTEGPQGIKDKPKTSYKIHWT